MKKIKKKFKKKIKKMIKKKFKREIKKWIILMKKTQRLFRYVKEINKKVLMLLIFHIIFNKKLNQCNFIILV